MLDLLAHHDPSESAALTDALTDHLHAVSAPGPRGDLRIVARIEAEVSADPEKHIRFDADRSATLEAAGRRFKAGRFGTPRLGDLRRQAEGAKAAAGKTGSLRFFVLDGASPATDIGTLQATAPAGSIFQVASQFNALEVPGASITPSPTTSTIRRRGRAPRSPRSRARSSATTPHPQPTEHASCRRRAARSSTCSRSSAPAERPSYRAAT
ncbi:Hypothetical protein A7982_00694 [Minicystis rosea]|nr:Hypothetical protein A7982_00694 [Minicystis rosea]